MPLLLNLSQERLITYLNKNKISRLENSLLANRLSCGVIRNSLFLTPAVYEQMLSSPFQSEYYM